MKNAKKNREVFLASLAVCFIVGNFLTCFCSTSSLQKNWAGERCEHSYSLFIAAQLLSCESGRKDLHNPPLRVTMRPTQMRKRFPSWVGAKSPVLGGKRF